MKKAATVTEYIAAAAPEARSMLRELRAAVKAAVPKVEEKIGYGIPYYKHHGMLVSFGAFKKHVSLFSMSNTFLSAHGKRLEKYRVSVGTLQFPLGTTLPLTLIRKAIQKRASLNEAKSNR